MIINRLYVIKIYESLQNLINSVTNDTEETSIGTDGMVPKSTGMLSLLFMQTVEIMLNYRNHCGHVIEFPRL